MKKILISLTIIGVLSAIVVGRTGAVFFDRELVGNNVFEAGYIDLRTQEGSETRWGSGETKTWETPDDNWAPGDTVSGTLRLKNDGNVDAARTTMLTNVIEVNTNTGRASDSEVTDETDMDTKIIFNQITFDGTNLLTITNNVFDNSSIKVIDANDDQIITLAELNEKELDFGAGIVTNTDKPLFMEFKFYETAGAGYQGDEVKVGFAFNIHQQ